MEPLNAIIIDERKKNRQLISNLLHEVLSGINAIEALDGGIASLKFENQKLDLLILNIDIKTKPALKLIKDVLDQRKISKDNIVVLYNAIDQKQLKELISFGVTDVISYEAEPSIIKAKLATKVALVLKNKSSVKKVA